MLCAAAEDWTQPPVSRTIDFQPSAFRYLYEVQGSSGDCPFPCPVQCRLYSFLPVCVPTPPIFPALETSPRLDSSLVCGAVTACTCWLCWYVLWGRVGIGCAVLAFSAEVLVLRAESSHRDAFPAWACRCMLRTQTDNSGQPPALYPFYQMTAQYREILPCGTCGALVFVERLCSEGCGISRGRSCLVARLATEEGHRSLYNVFSLLGCGRSSLGTPRTEYRSGGPAFVVGMRPAEYSVGNQHAPPESRTPIRIAQIVQICGWSNLHIFTRMRWHGGSALDFTPPTPVQICGGNSEEGIPGRHVT